MTTLPDTFSAFRIQQDDAGHRAGIETLSLEDLSPGDVVIRATYSSVNYKDALAGTGRGKILRRFPLVGGIDVAGTVVSSENPDFAPGDEVIVTGCGQSETRDGGYAGFVRAAADSVVRLPIGLSLREAMILGTAGFTAALALLRMERLGQHPEQGPIVVTGASGGVGTLAIDILTRAGYEVHAITGKLEQLDFLTMLGARQVISREKLYWGQRPLETVHWAGALDGVGGEMLEGLTRVIGPGGAIASYGMAGGIELHTTVMPFILRGISLVGLSASNTCRADRDTVWERLATTWRPAHLEAICTREIDLDTLPRTFQTLLDGQAMGRTVVRL
ncbi:acryloyl-CoA reductase [Xanthomonadaceae bacterium JHOS43]|nr:acryloyl-CoA reductase [Xanthomonadaceae bacterium JHOS43]MCX7564061.1 acryloyl-CoA reductase [Xanthomonadaceae bacterium XH05]